MDVALGFGVLAYFVVRIGISLWMDNRETKRIRTQFKELRQKADNLYVEMIQ